MQTIITQVLARHNYFSHLNQGIQVVKVPDGVKGISLAKEILYGTVDGNTILYLSGGRTPKDLYGEVAKDEILETGSVGLIDERYGEKWHANSNELMIRDTGILRYLQMRDKKFYPILQSGLSREEAAEKYDQLGRTLQNLYQKHIGILGVGMDGHTAGIAGNRHDFTNPMFAKEKTEHVMVSEFNDLRGMYKERVSMTFLGLSMLDFLLVLVFGEDKMDALKKMFSDGSEEDVPSRFFKRPEIAPKTLLITDQDV